MEAHNSVRILEVCKVAPSSSATESSLPLTFFDLIWFKLEPVELLFFYSLTDSDPPFPKLRHSLSLTLRYFLPLAGNLIWAPDAHKPIIHYTRNDAVSLTIAKSDADFDRLSSNHVREAIEFRPLVPKLEISDSLASVLALQLTAFPNKGFCIGITVHSAVLDGETTTMFMKSWASICKQLGEREPSLSPELTPFFDRTVIKDPARLDLLYLNQWMEITSSSGTKRSLKILSKSSSPDMVRATFELSRADTEKLRKRVMSWWKKQVDDGEQQPLIHLSTFVVTYAYVLFCMVKAKEAENNRKVYIFSADYRHRLDPPVPANYFGNCVGVHAIYMEEDGLAIVAKRVSDEIKKMEKGVRGAEELLAKRMAMQPAGTLKIGVAGSPQFGWYVIDFGWGRPKKVEVISIEKTGAISMAENRDGNGGVEVGVALKKHEMDKFASLFRGEIIHCSRTPRSAI